MFYIDSSSAQLMEFGTIDYPYKTLKPVFIEVLNHLSNQQVDIKINLKQNTQYYLEDDVSYLINISSVTFDSYSDNGTVDSRAKIIPTRMQQIEL